MGLFFFRFRGQSSKHTNRTPVLTDPAPRWIAVRPHRLVSPTARSPKPHSYWWERQPPSLVMAEDALVSYTASGNYLDVPDKSSTMRCTHAPQALCGSEHSFLQLTRMPLKVRVALLEFLLFFIQLLLKVLKFLLILFFFFF